MVCLCVLPPHEDVENHVRATVLGVAILTRTISVYLAEVSTPFY